MFPLMPPAASIAELIQRSTPAAWPQNMLASAAGLLLLLLLLPHVRRNSIFVNDDDLPSGENVAAGADQTNPAAAEMGEEKGEAVFHGGF